MRCLRGSFRLEPAYAAHLGRWHRFPRLWRAVPVVVVDGGGFSAIRFRAVEDAYRIAGGAGRIGIAGGIEVAAGAHALLRGLVSLDADRLWRATQDARQPWAIATLSDADARERLHSGEVVAKGYGLRETRPPDGLFARPERENSHPCLFLVDGYQRARIQLRSKLTQNLDDPVGDQNGIEVIQSHLDDARLLDARKGESYAEVQIVCQHHVAVERAVGHDFGVRRGGGGEARPMERLDAGLDEHRGEPGRHIHVEQNLHASVSSASRSSIFQAA